VTLETGRTAVREDGAPAGEGITFYGTGWCPDSRRSRALLDRLAVPYAFVDLDADEAATTWAAAQNGGVRRIPTIALGVDGPILIEPSDDELGRALRERGLVDRGEGR
jgi:glutaredoxin